ncbi:MAG: methylenetetrahydrofolate--tRNA-(uracil(54)-C(5))-methyltransferase (FADH(2)-oxidizing) TrmFO [Ruminococcus sp.]|nr:methylenetetrahydrofolate--tRNA-(uracil(54)-C(5))-methyltransferase (FADH(2)-oxidizing) TrmFO [Ruminococcus sp.]MBQ6153462.1 methylenetetrahydrofolate--tRNA-(uracil(54)-C(5))-methyltransferase (FADH(2)-oxidizing) TrmFO [Ruminococcus sp.]
MSTVNVIGAGLAGCEAAYQLSKRGIKVRLYDAKPLKKSPAHHEDYLCELVCSNSFKANRVNSAAGLLKEEMRRLDSLLMKCADSSAVPAGGALAVDRDEFSRKVTQYIENDGNITFISQEIESIPEDGITVIATGPLTFEKLSDDIRKRFGEQLRFFDAAAPIVSFESIDMNCAFFESRYGKGDGEDYLNCPMNKEEYEVFYSALISAERARVHEFDVMNPKVYEGCMPIEVMAQRGVDTVRFGPMKPVGLRDPRTGHRPWAVLQLRKENREGTMYNLVGFQTNLKFGEQKRVFSLIPALKNAEFLRYGVMHRNTFLDSPRLLNADYSLKENKDIFFAGQITGVEGYMESASSGLMAGINAACRAMGEETVILPKETMIGALSRYISDDSVKDFQPMGANFGILPELADRPRDKALRGQAYADRSLYSLEEIKMIQNI